MRILLTLILTLVFTISAYTQEVWQLQPWPSDSNYVLGAFPTGEPTWVHKNSLGGVTSVFISGDSLYVVIGTDTTFVGMTVDDDADPTNELPVINLIYDEFDLPSTPCKTGDFATDGFNKWWVCQTDAPSWLLLSQAQLIEITYQSLAGDSIYEYRVDVSGNSASFAIKVDNTLKLSNLGGAPATAVIKVDTSVIATLNDLLSKQNTLVSGTNIKTINGNSLLGSGNLVISTVDSTNVSAGYGIDVTESPANTFTIKADTSEVATPYDLTLKQNQLTGTAGETIRFGGTNTPISSSLLYNNGTNIGIGTTSPVGGSKLTVEGGAIFSRPTFTDATMQLYNPADAGAGILFDDLSSGSDYLYYHGQHKTFSLGTAIATSTLNKKLNVVGGCTIGSGYSTTAVDANSLKVEGSVTIGTTSGTAVSNAALDSNGKIVSSTLTSGTVTSVGLGLGTSGTDANISGSPITGSGSFTLNLPSASGSNRGLLTSANWTTFNNKFTLPSLTAGSVLFSNGSTIAQDNSNFFWDDTNNRLGLGTATPNESLEIIGKASIRKQTNDNSICIGQSAGGTAFTTSTEGNVSIGAFAGQFLATGGLNNMNIGSYSGNGLTTGDNNVNVGRYSGFANTTSSGNVNIGDLAGGSNTGSTNTNIGFQAGRLGTAVSGCVNIGNEAGYSNTTSNRLYINNSTATSLISGRFDDDMVGIQLNPSDITNTLDVNGTLRVRTTTGTATAAMGRDANGVMIALGHTNGLVVSGGNLNLPAGVTTGNFLRWNGSAWASDVPIFSFGVSGSTTNISCNSTMNALVNGGTNIETTNSGGTVTVRQKSPYTMMTVNSYNVALTTTNTKMALSGQSSTNGDGTDINYDNANDEIDILTTGTYKISYNCNCKSNTAAVTVQFNLIENVSSGTLGAISTHYFNNTNEFCHNNMEYIYPFNSGDRFSLYAKTISGTTTIEDCNIRMFAERIK